MEMNLNPIGVVRTPFTKADGTPIQPRMVKEAQGRIEIVPQWRDALKDLDGFERIWLLCWFDRAAPPKSIIKPYMDDSLRGLFATRTPSRPNPIGLSCVRLLAIEEGVLKISEVDILDGTPLLDIKPYHPRFDCYPEARGGWLDGVDASKWSGTTADDRFENKMK